MNKELNMLELAEFEKKIILKDYPYSICVEPSAYCNLRCKMCGNATMKREKGYMKMELFQKIADELADNSAETHLWIGGYGEPLLNQDTYKMIDYATQRGLMTYMNTNAMLLDEQSADALIASGLGQVVISLDGFSSRVYEAMRVGGNRDIVYKNVLRLLDKLSGIKNKKMLVELQFIESEDTLPDKEQWLEFWSGKGAYIKLKPFITWGRWISTDRTYDFTERKACGSCNLMSIQWDGKIPYCAVGDIEGENICGDVTKQTIYDIWNNGKKKHFSCYHITHQFEKLPQYCQQCPDWTAVASKQYDTDGNLIQ